MAEQRTFAGLAWNDDRACSELNEESGAQARSRDAAQADINQLPDLLHGDESVLYGDKAYWSERDRGELESIGVRYQVTRRGKAGEPLSERWQEINRSRSRVRARVEHPFHVVKRLWGFRKVRYRGLRKNAVRAYAAFALANLYLVRKRLLGTSGASYAL